MRYRYAADLQLLLAQRRAGDLGHDDAAELRAHLTRVVHHDLLQSAPAAVHLARLDRARHHDAVARLEPGGLAHALDLADDLAGRALAEELRRGLHVQGHGERAVDAALEALGVAGEAPLQHHVRERELAPAYLPRARRLEGGDLRRVHGAQRGGDGLRVLPEALPRLAEVQVRAHRDPGALVRIEDHLLDVELRADVRLERREALPD